MHLLAPSILSADFSKLESQINLVESAGADLIHLDVMDGHFVPNITFGPKMVRDINSITNLPLDVHLMIEHPEKYIKDFANSGADWISVHYETCDYLDSVLNMIKDNGCKAGVVINPATSVDVLNDSLNISDFVLLMSVNPGFGGQSFIKYSLEKAKKLREEINRRGNKVFIEMDGGIGIENIIDVKESGVNVFVCGNSIFGSPDISSAVNQLKNLINK